MAKRFTATEKWSDSWYRRLKAKDKLLWQYMLDNCDVAGIWEVDLDYAGQHTGFKYTESEVRKAFAGRIVEVPNKSHKWFIANFVTFQYGTLKPSHPLHRKVLNILQGLGLQQLSQSEVSLTPVLPQSEDTLMEEEEEKEEDKEEEKEEEKESKARPKSLSSVEDLFRQRSYDVREAEKFWNYYESNGWRVGRNPMRNWKAAAANWMKNAKQWQKSPPVNETPQEKGPRTGKVLPMAEAVVCPDHPGARQGPEKLCLTCFPLCSKCKHQHSQDETCEEVETRLHQIKRVFFSDA